VGVPIVHIRRKEQRQGSTVSPPPHKTQGSSHYHQIMHILYRNELTDHIMTYIISAFHLPPSLPFPTSGIRPWNQDQPGEIERAETPIFKDRREGRNYLPDSFDFPLDPYPSVTRAGRNEWDIWAYVIMHEWIIYVITHPTNLAIFIGRQNQQLNLMVVKLLLLGWTRISLAQPN